MPSQSQTAYKATAEAYNLQMELNQRLNGSLTFTVLADTDGYPYLSAGSGTAGGQNVIIKVINYLAQQNAAAVTASEPKPYNDSLGLGASPYSPTIVQLVTEAFSSSSFGNGTNASGTITITGGAGATSAVIAGKTVTVTWTTSDNNTASLLAAAILADPTANKLVTASALTNVVTVTALPGLGAAGNSIGFTASGTGVVASGSGFLTGGTTTSGTGGALSLLPQSILLPVLGDLFACGTIFQSYLTAAGTPPTPGAGTLQATYTISNQYGFISTN